MLRFQATGELSAWVDTHKPRRIRFKTDTDPRASEEVEYVVLPTDYETGMSAFFGYNENMELFVVSESVPTELRVPLLRFVGDADWADVGYGLWKAREYGKAGQLPTMLELLERFYDEYVTKLERQGDTKTLTRAQEECSRFRKAKESLLETGVPST